VKHKNINGVRQSPEQSPPNEMAGNKPKSRLDEDLYRSLFSVLYRMIEDERTAERLAQQVVIGCFRTAQSSRTEVVSTMSFYRQGTTVVLKYLHNQRRMRPEPNALGNRVQSGPDQQTPEEKRIEAIKESVRQLPEQQRIALILNKYEHLDAKQIAQVLDRDEVSVRTLLSQAYTAVGNQLRKLAM
jgi:RNA polymerase sigma-70 factor (ECF subfamily)